MKMILRKIPAVLLLLVLSTAVYAAETHGMTVLEREDRGSYDCLLVEYAVPGNEKVRSFLLLPHAASRENPCPGLVLLHDHGARFDIGKEKLVRPAGAPANVERSSAQWAMKYFDGRYFGDYLASKGYVVLAADALYWGERSSEDARRWSCLTFGDAEDIKLPSDSAKAEVKRLKDAVYQGQAAVYDSLAAQGTVWAEKILQDDIASVKLLCSLPFVDRNRIGAFGFSMGAHRCWLLSAFSDDIRFGAAVCWMLMKADYDSSSVSDLSMRIRKLRDSLDFPDIAGLACPKPMLFINGRTDHLFPEASAAEAFRRISEIYSVHGVPGMAVTSFSDGGHHCGREVQDSVYAFFARCVSADE